MAKSSFYKYSAGKNFAHKQLFLMPSMSNYLLDYND